MSFFRRRGRVVQVVPFRDDGASWQARQRHQWQAPARRGGFPVTLFRICLAYAGGMLLLAVGLLVGFVVYCAIGA